MDVTADRRLFWRHLALIVGVSTIALFTNLGGPRLWDRDEPRNAGCAWEMLQRGDWVVPVFNGELRAHKPVLLYWLIMAAYSVFGVNEFAARFWSAALSIGTALATYGIGRRLFGPRIGLWSAVILSTSLMFDVAGRAATPDATLNFFSTLSLWVYVCWIFPPVDAPRSGAEPGETSGAAFASSTNWFPTRWTAVASMYALMGVAVLAKGPVGCLLPTLVIGLFVLLMRCSTQTVVTCAPTPPTAVPWWRRVLLLARPLAPSHVLRTIWSMRPLTACLAVTAVALPWYAWVGWRTDGRFLEVFFWEHNWGRATNSLEGHSGSLLFYPVAILVGFFPWSIFAVPTWFAYVAGLRRRDALTPGYVFAACWVVCYIGIFSLARTKLPSYVTPCYPALALLTGSFVDQWVHRRLEIPGIWPLLALTSLALVGLVIGIAVPLLAPVYLPGEAWLGLMGMIPLAGAVISWRLTRRERRGAAAVVLAICAVLWTTALLGGVTGRIDRHQQYPALVATVAKLPADAQIGAYGWLEPSFVFYARRRIQDLDLDPDEVQAPAGSWEPRLYPHPAEFFGEGNRRYIITTDREWETLRSLLPPCAVVLQQCPLLFRHQRLLLIGRAAEPPDPTPAATSAGRRTPAGG